jgi:halocyanin-like protein
MNGNDNDRRNDCVVKDRRTTTDSQLSRRRVLRTTVGLGSLTAIAGCSSETGDDGNGGDDSDDTVTPTPTPTESADTEAPATTQAMESMCQVAENSVDGLSVVGCQSEERDGNLVVNMRVRNDGQQETDLFNYDYPVTLYDGTDPSSANNIGSAGQSTLFPGSSVVQPGETARIRVTVGIRDSASLSDLQLYTITVECGNSDDGSYCEPESADGGDGGAQSEVYDYLSDDSSFNSIWNYRGTDSVTVMVGAKGNNGNFAFKQSALRVDVGTTVTWEWTGQGGQHNVVAEDGTFESDLSSEEGNTFEHTFEETGVILYYCQTHKTKGMKGAVIVL